MPVEVAFIFGLGPNEPALSEQSDLWSAPLPMRRQAFDDLPDDPEGHAALSYGDYFVAARDYLSQDNFAGLAHAADLMTDQAVSADDIRQVAVYLLKHGAFYHPAYVAVDLGQRQSAFVLNVAVSRQGREALPREFNSLVKLNATFATTYWPAVYGQGSGTTPSGKPLPMFIGQWFSEWYEFHLTQKTDDGRQAVVVWDTGRGPHVLGEAAASDLMRQAAAILTSVYNPLTFDAILDWHHAAGDFVVQTSGAGIDLRLITVRNYAPFIRPCEPDIEAVLDGLLLFLVSLTLRLRLDRLDGVGEPAAYPGFTVPAICRGFWQGLAMSAAAHGLPEELVAAAADYFPLHGPQQLAPLADAVLANYPPVSNEGRLLRALTSDHLDLLAESIAPPGRA